MIHDVPLLFLDLDGTVRKGPEFMRWVHRPGDVEVFPEAVTAMAAWKRGGGRIIGVSNQGGVALGHVSVEDVDAATAETVRQTGGLFDHIAVCLHHPRAADPRWSRCWCRKPAPGLLIGAAAVLERRLGESYPACMALMVGDRREDEAAAAAASVDFQWASEWRAVVAA